MIDLINVPRIVHFVDKMILTGLPCKIKMRSIQVTQLVCQNKTIWMNVK